MAMTLLSALDLGDRLSSPCFSGLDSCLRARGMWMKGAHRVSHWLGVGDVGSVHQLSPHVTKPHKPRDGSSDKT